MVDIDSDLKFKLQYRRLGEMCKFESCVLEGLVASVDVMDGVLYSRWLYNVGNTLAKVS